MPLTGNVSENIHELTHHGSRPRSHKQIVAIAMHAAHESNHNDDHHASHNIGNAHPHQSHSQPHHGMSKLPIAPNTKSYDQSTHSVRGGVPHHQHRHTVHDRRQKGMEHKAGY